MLFTGNSMQNHMHTSGDKFVLQTRRKTTT